MKVLRLLLAGLLAIVLAGCAAEPSRTTGSPAQSPQTPAGGQGLKVCQVADASGFADGSFNQTVHNGLLRAADELGVATGEIQAPGEADYAAAVESLVDADCELIILVGFKHADAAQAAAQANPQVDFLLVDAMVETPLDNLKPLLFDPAGAAFLAGYLAAAQSRTGAVATFGAVKNADVLLFLNGYAGGVAHFNQTKDADVQLLGWDVETQDGQFITSQAPFQDVAAGKTTAENLAGQGADVIFPVAGMAGTGALQVAQESGGEVQAIWVDSDGCLANPSFCPVILTSVVKAMDVAVFDAISAAVDGQFSNEPYHGTLANEGVGLSPFHELDDQVSAQTRAELEQIREQLIDGSITPPAAG